jgi:hypothetical protein
MNYEFKNLLPNEPITIWTGYEGFEFGSPEEEEIDNKVRAVWTASEEPVYHIVNMSQLKLDLNQLMVAAAGAAFGEDALWSHPNLKMAIVVTQDPIILQAVGSMIQSMETGQSPYSQVPIMLLESVDEALEYIRAELH